jgi:hypothetical protein
MQFVVIIYTGCFFGEVRAEAEETVSVLFLIVTVRYSFFAALDAAEINVFGGGGYVEKAPLFAAAITAGRNVMYCLKT